MNMKILGRLLWVMGVLLAVSCSREEENPGQRGALVNSTSVAVYDLPFVQGIVSNIQGIGEVDLRYRVEAVKMRYLTANADGDVVHASGLVLVPMNPGAYPILSIQHGTIAKRSAVSSRDPMLNEGLVGIITAAEGYVTLIPDYLGLGDSQEMHPYLVGEVLAGNVTDMIRAVRSYMQTRTLAETGELFLAGYSEGGYVTMATHRMLETQTPIDGLQISGVAPMAGPYDLKMTFDTILSYKTYASPVFVAYTLTAYDEVYHWNRLDQFFQEPYASLFPGAFDGTHSAGWINDRLTTDLRDLLQPDILQGYLSGTDTQLPEALQKNSLLGWGPQAPVRLYHGTADTTVPYCNGPVALKDLTAHGGRHVSLVSIPHANHDGAVVPAFIGAVHWFDSLRVK